MWLNHLAGLSLFGTLSHGKPDFATLKPVKDVTPIAHNGCRPPKRRRV